MNTVTVIKRNPQGEAVLNYEGEVIERNENFICIQATFELEGRDLGYINLKRGDVFTEWFYSDRWYNIFRVKDKDSGELKGFYCNITRPAEIEENRVASDDLELDVFVKPNGEILHMDFEEYDALNLDLNERVHVDRAVAEIGQMVEDRLPPFDEID